MPNTMHPTKRSIIFRASFVAVLILFTALCSKRDKIEDLISFEQVDSHIRFLSSDELKGRGSFSEDVRLAEDYIAEQFKGAGLEVFSEFPAYRHEFTYTYRNRRDPEAEPQKFELANIVGYLEGRDPQLKDEYVVFGAHHDHVGIRGDAEDNIYNGANDNATGTTAVITLAHYYAKTRNNKRSLLFVTFAAEERGMIGSRQIVKDLPFPIDKIAAVINFEMIGKSREEGELLCYLTGWDRSDLGSIMQESLGDSPYWLRKGSELTDRLFFASDNITFAREGVVAHTLAGIKSTNDPLMHTPGDEYETIDVDDMTQIIRGVVKASETLISGERTPEMLEPLSTRNDRP